MWGRRRRGKRAQRSLPAIGAGDGGGVMAGPISKTCVFDWGFTTGRRERVIGMAASWCGQRLMARFETTFSAKLAGTEPGEAEGCFLQVLRR